MNIIGIIRSDAMKKMKMIACISAMLLGGLACAGDNLFPIGRFNWNRSDCEVVSETKEGKYSCGMFLAKPEGGQKHFFFYYGDINTEAGPCGVTLDTETKYRDANQSLKLDFSKINAAVLHRFCFMFPKVEMKKDKIYEATVYLKSEEPGMKLAASLMGDRKTNKEDSTGLYKFTSITTASMWQAFKFDLKMSDLPGTLEANFNALAIDAASPGILYIGSIDIQEKDAAQ